MELRRLFFYLAILTITAPAAAQNDAASEPLRTTFRGTASLTHNGISLVPSFSLGEPALLLDLKVARGRWSFEPDLRLGLDGKPWSMLFWVRYKAVQKGRFSLRTGAHPALNFRTIAIQRGGTNEDVLESRRYFATEVVPNYRITDRFSVGAFWLLGHGFDEGTRTINFLTLNAAWSGIPLGDKLSLSFSPQVYYLGQDDLRGYYTVSYLTLALKNAPFSVTGVVNQAIDTQILPDDPSLWTVLFNYRFGEGTPKMRKGKRPRP